MVFGTLPATLFHVCDGIGRVSTTCASQHVLIDSIGMGTAVSDSIQVDMPLRYGIGRCGTSERSTKCDACVVAAIDSGSAIPYMPEK